MAANPLNERLSVVVTEAVLNSEKRKKIMLVSWHGPTKTKQKVIRFLEFLSLVDHLRQDYCPEAVAVVGGDFNYRDCDARDELSGKPDLEVLTSDEEIIYAIVWPKGHLELLPGFPTTLPASEVSTENDTNPPFDHNITLYRFRVREGVMREEGGPQEGVMREEGGP